MLQGTKHPCDRSELGHQIKEYKTLAAMAGERLKALNVKYE